MYAMVCTRPTLTHALSVVIRYMMHPRKTHQTTVTWIIRYSKGSLKLGLTFNGNIGSKEEVIGYVDSDYTTVLDTRRS